MSIGVDEFRCEPDILHLDQLLEGNGRVFLELPKFDEVSILSLLKSWCLVGMLPLRLLSFMPTSSPGGLERLYLRNPIFIVI